MKFRLLIISILSVFSLFLHAAHLDVESSDSKTFSYVAKIPFQAKILPSSSDLIEEEKGFKETFLEAYAPFTALELYGEEGVGKLGGAAVAKESALTEAFQEEKEALGVPGISHIRLQTLEGNLIGYFSFEEWNLYDKKPADFPENSIYVRQFYVLPSFQHKGVGTIAMSELLRCLTPSAQHIYIATRRINKGARTLYEHLGFKEREESLHGLSPEKYISYELHLEA